MSLSVRDLTDLAAIVPPAEIYPVCLYSIMFSVTDWTGSTSHLRLWFLHMQSHGFAIAPLRALRSFVLRSLGCYHCALPSQRIGRRSLRKSTSTREVLPMPAQLSHRLVVTVGLIFCYDSRFGGHRDRSELIHLNS